MGLRDLTLKQAYDSDEDNILGDFYVPALSESKRYRRLAGFFSSSALAVAARGIYNFILNGGEIDLLVSANLTRQDVEAIRVGLNDAERLITDNVVADLNGISEGFMRDHVKALSWMVAKGKLRIKVAIPFDENGLPLDRNAIDESGIFHQKVGILSDENGDAISFSGSINETAYAWLHNIEEFKVFKQWEPSSSTYFQSDLEKMDKYWNNKATSTKVIDVPTAITEKLISLAPENLETISLRVPTLSRVSEPLKIQLRPYQTRAIESWKDHNFQGIFSMATGTGKTIVALGAIRKHVPASTLVVIAVPTMLLAEQWRREVQKMFPDATLVECDSSRSDWEERLGVLVKYTSTATDESRRVFVIATYHTAGTSRFGSSLDKLPAAQLCLIADEVHHAGAPFFSNLLGHNFRWRLGLSATPHRFWDEEGQERLTEFFGGVIFDYPISDALKDKVLCEYNYHIVPAVLDEDELNLYSETTTGITRKMATLMKDHPTLRGLPFPRLLAELSKASPDDFSALQALIIKRVNILRRARNKGRVLSEIVRPGRHGRCLVYCNDLEHVEEAISVLSALNADALRYDSSMNLNERERSLESFSANPEGYLVAVKCLDEGVDIPSCDTAILVSSSKSSREFIQRRGRLLRKHPDKLIANIYDIMVLPIDPASSSRGLSELEFAILDDEIERARLFAESARNRADAVLQIARLEDALASKVIHQRMN